MSLMLITTALVFISSHLAALLGAKVPITNIGVQQERYPLKVNTVLVIITTFILTFVSGFRLGFVDTYTYRSMYARIGTDFANVFGGTTAVEWGFNFFMYLLNLISADSQILLIVTSIIINAFVVATVYKYSSSFTLSLYLYITSGAYLVSMNGIRQFIITAIMFFLIKYIIEGKAINYFLFALVLSTIHTSAVLFIPIYFLARRKAFDFRLIIGVAVTCLLVATGSFSLITKFLLVTEQYSEYNVLILSGDTGASVFRVLVAFVPVFLSALYLIKGNKPDQLTSLCINFSIINLIFYILSLQTWIFARVNIYFDIYNIILIPNIINGLFKEVEDNRFLFYLTYISYFGYFLYQLHAYGDHMRGVRLIFNL